MTRLIKTKENINGLPIGFQEVEYLQSSGTEWIDTGVTINTATDEVEMYFQLMSTTLYQWLMGEHDNGARFGVGVGDGTNKRNIAYGATTYKVNDTQVYNSMHKFVANSNGVYLDGVQVHAFESFSSTSTIYLFNLNISGGAGLASGKIWTYRHKRNGVLIRDLIPCLDNNETPCMWDTITKKPYRNQGTGTFSYGSPVYTTKTRLIKDGYQTKTRLIPSWLDDYTFVNYIQSTGTQYINTGVTLTNNHSVEIDYQLTQASQSRAGLFGNLNMTGSNQGRFGSLLSPSNQQLEHGYGTGNDYWQQGSPDTNRHKLYQKKNEIYFDGTLIHTFTSATFTLNTTAPLGSFGYTNYTPAKAKYYNSKWWDGDTLIRNFIPAIRKSESAVGMIDTVNRVFYTNQGTGVFSYG